MGLFKDMANPTGGEFRHLNEGSGSFFLLSRLADWLGIYALGAWGSAEFGALSPERTMRLVIPSGTAVLLAFQIGYGAFLLSVLEIRSGR